MKHSIGFAAGISIAGSAWTHVKSEIAPLTRIAKAAGIRAE